MENFAENSPKQHKAPTIHVKSWFNNGAYLNPPLIEAYNVDLPLMSKGPQLDVKANSDSRRALRGCMLRHEIYQAVGASKAPYKVHQLSYSLEQLQPSLGRIPARYRVLPHEELTSIHDNNTTTPRMHHVMMLQVNDYGDVLSSIAINYGREIAQ